MPINPCGRVVDFARRPYRTACRFFKDNEEIEIPIQWYRAAPGAPSMPFPTSFMSIDWTSSTETRISPSYVDEPWLQRPGEVFNEPRPYSPWPVPLGLTYDHVCGTEEEFVDGAEYDPDREVEYDEQGLPLCCRGPIVPMFPLVLGFEAELEILTPGFSCATALQIAKGIDYVFTAPPFGQLHWFRFHFEPGDPSGVLYWEDPPLATNLLDGTRSAGIGCPPTFLAGGLNGGTTLVVALGPIFAPPSDAFVTVGMAFAVPQEQYRIRWE